ncbi:hypothetical protein SDC9_174123 [bioreactor metagenome]|uniref:Uncharacterized protein n=1 Tax=bioreactor metagenome TaxID=1076179 RepID=A0A645GIF3_9ZZZZ
MLRSYTESDHSIDLIRIALKAFENILRLVLKCVLCAVIENVPCIFRQRRADFGILFTHIGTKCLVDTGGIRLRGEQTYAD